ncbi:MAG: sigma-54 dependent transcriptional regulator [Desulfohalobiaceae bacterium]|nr:sigma-54 dependent transcriptional regulator [Desulfohalobiaceae bacterium]
MHFPEPVIIGTSPAIQKVLQVTYKVSNLDLNVLITGESGVGKELIARSLHYHSHRRNRPFVKVNSAALPSELLESELFGYEKGAFTGADRTKSGKFEMAKEGTIFLDEIGELPIYTQSKLLQVLQDREYYRVGGHASQEVKARIIAATNQDLDAEINGNNFRADLYYRLSTISIHIPPLRDRKEDIMPLVEHFSKYLQQEKNLPEINLSPELIGLFHEYHWPGNVRELVNYLQRHSVFGNSQEIMDAMQSSLNRDVDGSNRNTGEEAEQTSGDDLVEYQDIIDGFDPDNDHFPSLKEVRDQVVKRVERDVIEKVLLDSNWNRKAAARALKISYRALLYKIKEMDIHPTKH